MRIIRSIGVIVIVGLLCLGLDSLAQAFKPFDLKMSAYIKTDNQKKFENSRIAIKALDKFRIEQTVGAQTVTTIANGRDLWEVRTLNNTCLHKVEEPEHIIQFGKQTLHALNPVPDFRKKGGKPAGKAKIDGVLCSAFRRSDPAGKDGPGVTHTMWVAPDGRLRRMLSAGMQRGALSLGAPVQTHLLESRVDYKWLAASSLDESLFQPPAGMKVSEGIPNKR